MSEVIGAGIGIGMLILLGFVYVLVMALSVVSYVFMALGIGGMMKSFGMPHPGCAFIPVYNTYLLGKVAEESSVRLGDSKVQPFGKILLIIQCVSHIAGTDPETFFLKSIYCFGNIAYSYARHIFYGSCR